MSAHPPIPLPDPPLTDDDVHLRPWRPEDAPALAAAWADPEIARWTGVPLRADVETARRWIEGDAHRRARGASLDLVVDLAGRVAGEVGLAKIDSATGTAEIGWWIAPGERRRGLGTRAARLVTAWALDELAVSTVLARCHRANPGSGGVARAAGFTLAATRDEIEVWRCP